MRPLPEHSTISAPSSALSNRTSNASLFPIDAIISKPLLTWRLRTSVEVFLRVVVEGVELVLAEPAALLVAQRRGDLVLLEPGPDAGQVVLVDERQRVGLEKAAEVDSDHCVEVIVRNGVHQGSNKKRPKGSIRFCIKGVKD